MQWFSTGGACLPRKWLDYYNTQTNHPPGDFFFFFFCQKRLATNLATFTGLIGDMCGVWSLWLESTYHSIVLKSRMIWGYVYQTLSQELRIFARQSRLRSHINIAYLQASVKNADDMPIRHKAYIHIRGGGGAGAGPNCNEPTMGGPSLQKFENPCTNDLIVACQHNQVAVSETFVFWNFWNQPYFSKMPSKKKTTNN